MSNEGQSEMSTVVFYSEFKKFGFIARDDGAGPDVFVHRYGVTPSRHWQCSQL